MGVPLDRSKRFAIVAMCSLVAACASIVGPIDALGLGFIVNDSAQPVTVPDSVTASTDFLVSLETSGGGCNRVRNTQVTMVDSRTAEIRPYDYFPVNTPQCPANLLFIHHTATLRFGQPGTATVRLIGQYNDSTITITRTVVVH